MIRSMTGFGQAQRQVAGAHYSVEIRSLNSRSFKGTIKLPELWSSIETDIDHLLRDRLHRGTVYFVMRMRAESSQAAYQVNTAALDSYLAQLEAVRPDQTDVKITIDMASMLLLPGVCVPPMPEEIIEKAQADVTAMIEEAVGVLLAMRQQEGLSIVRDLTENLAIIEKQLAGIAGRVGLVVQDYQQRLKRRIEELLGVAGGTLKDADLAREVAIFAERCDVAEEISRLTNHLGQFRTAISKEDQPGRKLDFLAQEMLREANTIASKSNDSAIAQAVVEIKTAIDRIKEQVQNVE